MTLPETVEPGESGRERFAALRPDEVAMLTGPRCEGCGHLVVLHNDHCCPYCTVPDCECEWCKCAPCDLSHPKWTGLDWGEAERLQAERAAVAESAAAASDV